MPIKKVFQSVPAGAVAPSPMRPPQPWLPRHPAPLPVPAEDPVEYPSEDGIPMAASLKSLLQKSADSPDPSYQRPKTLEMTEIWPARRATAHVVALLTSGVDLRHRS